MSTYMITHRNPAWNRLSELDRLFESLWQPSENVEEKEEHFLLSFEVPGVPKDRIQIEVTDDVLSVSGEGRRGRLQRSFTLPQGVDTSKIEAHAEDGILQIYVPKSEQAKPRQIKVSQSTAPDGFFARLLGSKKEQGQTTERVA